MTKKVFSIEDGSLEVLENGHIYLFDNGMVATTERNRYGTYLLPSTLIRHPKSDEELAEEKFPDLITGQTGFTSIKLSRIKERLGFISGRKSVGGEYHLTMEQLEDFAIDILVNLRSKKMVNKEMICEYLKPFESKAIYPTSIEVDFDGTNYLWTTLKANYD